MISAKVEWPARPAAGGINIDLVGAMPRLLAALLALLASTARAEPLDRLAKELVERSSAGRTLKVAVLEFPYLDGALNPGSLIVQEQLTTILAGHGRLEVLERRLIDKLIDELRLQTTGLVDPKAATRVGSFLGVDAIVSGSLHDVQDQTEVHARLIDCRTGKVLGAASARLKRSWPDASPRPPAREHPAGAPPVPAAAPSPSPQPARRSRPARRYERTPREEAEHERFFTAR